MLHLWVEHSSLIISIVSNLTIKDGLKKFLINILKEIYEKFKDPWIYNSLYCLGEPIDIIISNDDLKFIKCLDSYTKGNYLQCAKDSRKLLQENPIFFELYGVLAKSEISEGIQYKNPFKKGSLSFKVFEEIYNLKLKNEKTSNSLTNLFKVFNSIGYSTWSYKCFTFFNYERSISDNNINYHKYSHINSSYLNPELSLYIDNRETALLFLESFGNKTQNSCTVNFWTIIIQNLKSKVVNLNDLEEKKDVNIFRKELYKAQLYSELNQIDLAIELYDRLLSSKDYESYIKFIHNKEELVHGKIICLLKQKNFIGAVKLVVESILENSNLTSKLNYNILINHVVNSGDEDLVGEISTPIFLNLFNVPTNEIWIAYDDFLYYYGLNYPHELLTLQDNFNKDQLIYFLKNISKQEIYYSSYIFESQDDLDNERIEICLALAKLDETNAREYRNEISEISRNLLIRKGIKQIDESKIYVDVNGIRNSLEKDLKESFSRSLNLLNLSLDQIKKLDTSRDNIIVPYYRKGTKVSNKEKFSKDDIKLTSYSRFQQFVDMFYKIRDKFIASNEYGIDTYLSMRIRHGTLLGETRSVFENYQLITKKESSSGKYHDNEYWLNQLGIEEPIIEPFNNLMSEFSEEIDTLSDELKNKWLQVQTEKKVSSGLFNYCYDEQQLLKSFADIFGAIEDFEEFFDTVIDELWTRTEENLKLIREYISKDIKSQNISLLVKLSKDLEHLINKSKNLRLNEMIREITSCQTTIGTEFDKISQWFRRTNSKTINEFYLDLPIDASLTTLRRIYPDFSLLTPVIKNESQTKYEGEHFTQFTFLFQNLFENIIKHSELKANELNIELKLKEIEGRLIIIITNNISKKIDIEERNNNINETKELLTKEIGELSRSEGGTGYPKIKKILHIDFKRDNYLIIISNINEERIFKTHIEFSIKELVKNETKNKVFIN